MEIAIFLYKSSSSSSNHVQLTTIIVGSFYVLFFDCEQEAIRSLLINIKYIFKARLEPFWNVQDPVCEDIVIQEDTIICDRTPEPAPTSVNRPKKNHHHHHVQKITHHHHHKHNCPRRKAPVRSQSITNRTQININFIYPSQFYWMSSTRKILFIL